MTLANVLIALGIVPSIATGIYCYIHMYLSVAREPLSESKNGEQQASATIVPKSLIGDSEVAKASLKTAIIPSSSNDEPIFKILRTSFQGLAPAKWRFKIRFLLFNHIAETLGLDDMHAAVYLRIVPTPPLLTIGYRGEANLSQDNSLWKDNQSYSLARNDGFEMTLAMDLSRIEG